MLCHWFQVQGIYTFICNGMVNKCLLFKVACHQYIWTWTWIDGLGYVFLTFPDKRFHTFSFTWKQEIGQESSNLNTLSSVYFLGFNRVFNIICSLFSKGYFVIPKTNSCNDINDVKPLFKYIQLPGQTTW